MYAKLIHFDELANCFPEQNEIFSPEPDLTAFLLHTFLQKELSLPSNLKQI